jgi:hypothetical protein
VRDAQLARLAASLEDGRRQLSARTAAQREISQGEISQGEVSQQDEAALEARRAQQHTEGVERKRARKAAEVERAAALELSRARRAHLQTEMRARAEKLDGLMSS